MTTAQDLRRLTDQARARIASAALLKAEHELIATQTRARLTESSALLARTRARTAQEPAPRPR